MSSLMPPHLSRSLENLTSRRFDLLVVGGGIYGLTIAADASQRGLAVALIEREDFGSGTSFNHLRTIHGGLRYLQTLDLGRARESIRERRTLARIAPWAVRPLPFVLPLFRSLTKGPAALAAGFLLDRLIAGDRNDHVPESHHLQAGHVIGPGDARLRYPQLESLDLAGAAIWFDYVTTDADRLTLSWALSAAEHGAVVANYVEATELFASDGRVCGVHATDRPSGTAMRIDARTVVNATGAAIDRLLEPFGARTGAPMMQAVNVVTRRPALQIALGGRGRSGRNLFAVPWLDRMVLGTWESATTREAGDTAVDRADLAGFLDELNDAFPSFGLGPDDVTLVHRGVVPARLRSGKPPALEGHELVFDHAAEGLDGLTSVAGTKYTTARAVAERIVDRVCEKLGGKGGPCRTAELALPQVALQGDALLRHAAAHEMVMTLEDAVLRRTTLGAVGHPGDAALRRAADVVAAELGWDQDRRQAELAALDRAYRAYGTVNASKT